MYSCAFAYAFSLPMWAEKPMLETEIAEQSKGISIKGTVLDESGLPVIGANIMVKGSNTGTITDLNGYFSLSVPYADAVLTVSFIGYTSQDVPLKGRKEVKVVLVEDSKTLQEVVVVGFGSQKKATLTGAVASVNVKELSQSPSANITNALAGRMPGLTVTQFGGGEPGKDVASFAVRGLSSYNGGAQSPIIIVDGVERSLSSLDPNEIETFSILKDASATAVYGIRGANGVIIVTTKKGTAQSKPSVEFKAQAGIATPVSFPDYLGSADYARLYNQALKNDNPGWENDPGVQSRLFSDEMISNWERAKGDNTDGLGYNSAPHLIYLPEVPFDTDDFLLDVKRMLFERNNVIIAVSEGIRDASGNYISASEKSVDTFGHSQLSGAGKTLEFLVKEKLGVKVRSIEVNVLQRCAAHLASKTDLMESVRKIYPNAYLGKDGKSVTLDFEEA